MLIMYTNLRKVELQITCIPAAWSLVGKFSPVNRADNSLSSLSSISSIMLTSPFGEIEMPNLSANSKIRDSSLVSTFSLNS